MPVEMLLPKRRPKPSVAPWPYRPRPLPDELLSSYLCRLALGMDLKPISFLNTVFGSARNLLAQDLDNFAPPRIVRRVAHGVQRDPDVIVTARSNHIPARCSPTTTPAVETLGCCRLP